MGEQIVDLRATGAVLRRHRGTIAFIGLVGALLGAGVPLLRPPMYTSTSEVLLPTPVVVAGQAPDTQTQVEIASSQSVVGPAGRAAAPGLTFLELSKRVHVSAPSDQTLVFQASGPTAEAAETLAKSLASAELAYVAQRASSERDARVIGLLHRLQSTLSALRANVDPSSATESPELATLNQQLATVNGELQSVAATSAPASGTATVIQPASPATRPGFFSSRVLPIGVGLLAGALFGAVITLLLSRLDRRLRSRDQLAEAVGSPVVTSLRCGGARSIGGWHHLLAKFEPNPVDAWALRQLLSQVPVDDEGRRQITVVSPGADATAQALGPLLASYAAGTGVRTELVVGPGATTNSSLGTVLRRVSGEEVRPGLHVSAEASQADAALRVVVTTVHLGADPVTGLGGDAVLAVSPGTVTAKRLARTAIAAEDAGCRVIGVVVVDPDATDRTSGRLSGRGEGSRRDLPLRVARVAGRDGSL